MLYEHLRVAYNISHSTKHYAISKTKKKNEISNKMHFRILLFIQYNVNSLVVKNNVG